MSSRSGPDRQSSDGGGPSPARRSGRGCAEVGGAGLLVIVAFVADVAAQGAFTYQGCPTAGFWPLVAPSGLVIVVGLAIFRRMRSVTGSVVVVVGVAAAAVLAAQLIGLACGLGG